MGIQSFISWFLVRRLMEERLWDINFQPVNLRRFPPEGRRFPACSGRTRAGAGRMRYSLRDDPWMRPNRRV